MQTKIRQNNDQEPEYNMRVLAARLEYTSRLINNLACTLTPSIEQSMRLLEKANSISNGPREKL
jgi:hypothetical protein